MFGLHVSRRTAMALVAVGATAAVAGLTRDDRSPIGDAVPLPREFPVLPPSRPIRVAIPSIDVRAPIRPVGLAPDGSIAVPPLRRHWEVGWFARSPTPGQYGPTVLVGHADTASGPSVFHDLRRLRPRARIEVTRQDRRVAIFEVTSVERFRRTRLPAERVYADFTRPGLRLITCAGRWVGGGTGYSDNIVVFASLVDSRGP